MKLQNKVVLITGAGQGIGRAGALHFARQGARLVVNGLDAHKINETVRLIVAEGGEAIAVAGDITQTDAVAHIVDQTLQSFGRLDVLYNNAGVFLDGEGDLPSLDVWETTLKVNLTGTYLCCKAVLPVLVQNGGGAIILTSSFTALRGVTLPQHAYAVSKGGLVTLTQALAVQYGPYNIRVNCLAPGPVQTALFEKSQGDTLHLERIPLRRPGTPAEVAYVAAFLASDEASLITGAVVPVDGGLSATLIHHNTP
ncbi:MAG: SDR family NAD(P)-dependent oxidoreductase [Caldilinea sp.]|jgi:meso-butanediol dehydrogenase / (S,S)-butanediol dehydrogenase / diacetyl reductase